MSPSDRFALSSVLALVGLAVILVCFALATDSCLAPPCPNGWNSEARDGVIWCVAPETSLHPGVSR